MEENNKHTEPAVKKRKKRWWLKTIYILVAVFLIVDAFLFFLATPVLKTYLQNKVYGPEFKNKLDKKILLSDGRRSFIARIAGRR